MKKRQTRAFKRNTMTPIAIAVATAMNTPMAKPIKPETPQDCATEDEPEPGHGGESGRHRNRRFAVLSGARIRAARELSGITQQELAQLIGHATSAQVSLWEHGKRTVPMPELPAIAKALSVSADYLIGVSDEPERDPEQARRSILVGQLRDQLDAAAGHLADAVLSCGAELEGAIRATRLTSVCMEMASAVERFEAANADIFDDLKAGALLLRKAQDLAEASHTVGTALDEIENRRKRASGLARSAMNLPPVGPPPTLTPQRRAS